MLVINILIVIIVFALILNISVLYKDNPKLIVVDSNYIDKSKECPYEVSIWMENNSRKETNNAIENLTLTIRIRQDYERKLNVKCKPLEVLFFLFSKDDIESLSVILRSHVFLNIQKISFIFKGILEGDRDPSIGRSISEAIQRSSFTLSNLIALDIANCNFMDNGIETLVLKSPQLRNLKSLNLDYNGVTNRGAEYLSKSPYLLNIESLFIGGNQIKDDGFIKLINSPIIAKVTELRFNYCGISTSGFQALANSQYVTNINVLSIGDNDLTLLAFTALARSQYLKSLTKLTIHNNDYAGEISEEGLSVLLSSDVMSSVEVLELRNAQINAFSKRIFESPFLSKLKKFDLDDSFISDEGFKHFAMSKSMTTSLESMTWIRTAVRTIGATQIAKSPLFPNLRSMSFFDCSVGSGGAIAFAKSPYLLKLEDLGIDADEIDDRAAAAFADSSRLPLLSYLSLSDNDISSIGVNALVKSTTLQSKLQWLSLSGNSIGEDGRNMILNSSFRQIISFSDDQIS